MDPELPRVAVVSWGRGETSGLMADAWRGLGIDARVLEPPDAAAVLRPGDLAVVRLDVTQVLDGVEEGLRAVAALERGGVRVFNRPRALIRTHDKHATARALKRAGIPHPRTILARDLGQVRVLPLPFVVKPRFGSWGRDVLRCRTEQERAECLKLLRGRAWFGRRGAVVQELLPVLPTDLRVLVAGGQVVGACRRRSAPGEWRTNVSLGGSLVPAEPLPREPCELAVAAVAAIGGDFLEIDVLADAAGRPVVLEANAAPDFDRTYSLGGIDVFEAAATALGLAPAGPEGFRRIHTRDLAERPIRADTHCTVGESERDSIVPGTKVRRR